MSQNQVSELADYKQLIDTEIDTYVDHVLSRTQDVYGPHSKQVAGAYTQILQRGGKRIRGALTMVGYQMCGGTDQVMIVQAARAVEMMHAYMLIIDDIQDQSVTRRGGKTAHKLLEGQYGSEHTGISLALNAALLGSHGAGMAIGMLDVPDELRVKALNIMNNTMVVTAHGQTGDIINELSEDVTQADIDHVLQWKTAHYTVLNPLHTGMVLAGAGCEDTNAITQFALNLGKAFQITDDLLIVSNNSGKNAIDDIREGKQTILTLYALNNSNNADFLRSCLGNAQLSEQDFKKCQQILLTSGAVDYAQSVAEQYVADALESLHQYQDRWNPASVAFLENLAAYILKRDA